MGETIRNISGHSEELGDGRSVERGGFAEDVDLNDNGINQRLLGEGRITRVDPKPETTEPDPPDESEPDTRTEFQKLVAEAQDLGLKGALQRESADRLSERIAEAKKQKEAAQ